MKSKEKKSLSSRTVFKYMDIVKPTKNWFAFFDIYHVLSKTTKQLKLQDYR
jgi:hypothetical protein